MLTGINIYQVDSGLFLNNRKSNKQQEWKQIDVLFFLFRIQFWI